MGSTTVLIRTSGAISQSLHACYAEYLSVLSRRLAGLAHLHLLTDLSMWLPDGLSSAELRAQADEHERQLSRVLSGISVFAYTVADIHMAFPGAVWPIPGEMVPLSQYHNDTQIWFRSLNVNLRMQGRNTSRKLRGGQVLSNLLSYFIHEPSLCLWMRRRCGPRGRCDNGYVWVIEDDTAFVGDIRVPLLHYREHSTDLLSVFSPHPYIDDRWWLYVNPEFRNALAGVPLHKWEHVERYSSALVHRLEGLLERGVVAYGEVFGSTVCARSSWCTSGDLRTAKVVPSDVTLYGDSQPVTRKQLASALRAELRATSKMGRWLHAVKEGCQLLAIAKCFATDAKVLGDHSVPCVLPHPLHKPAGR